MRAPDSGPPDPPPEEQHPRGTLAIVGVYGLLFLIGWLVFYFVVFAGRGHVH